MFFKLPTNDSGIIVLLHSRSLAVTFSWLHMSCFWKICDVIKLAVFSDFVALYNTQKFSTYKKILKKL
jgi:hypothetical protein